MSRVTVELCQDRIKALLRLAILHKISSMILNFGWTVYLLLVKVMLSTGKLHTLYMKWYTLVLFGFRTPSQESNVNSECLLVQVSSRTLDVNYR